MLSNSLKRLNKTNRLITVEDISDSLLAGRSAAHTACWKYLQLASYDAALEHAEHIINREPDKPDGYVFKARALFQKGLYQDSEAVLLKVMKIAQESDLIRSDVEGMVKLKDELANSRVEILRSRQFREPIDIAEMHWNDCNKPILELIGFATRGGPSIGGQARVGRLTRGGAQSRGMGDVDLEKSDPMEVDISIIDIIGTEKAKQLYPELLGSSPTHKSTPNSYSQRRTVSFSNLDLSGDFPTPKRAANREPELRKSASNENLSDSELRSAGLKTSLLLAEEKNEKNERKIKTLEEELRKVYERVLKLNNENKVLEKKCNTLVSQLDKVVGKGSAFPAKKESDPEVQILREVAANKRKKALVTLRNSWRSNGISFVSRTPALHGLKRRPGLGSAQNRSRQRPLVFTNSNRSAQRLQGVNRVQGVSRVGLQDVNRDIFQAFVKLKYELAATRKEILKSVGVINVKDVAKRHLNNFEASITELHSVSDNSLNTSTPLENTVVKTEDEVELDVNVVPKLEFIPLSDSLNQTYHSSEEEDDEEDDCDSYSTPLYNNDFGSEDVDIRHVTISRTEYFRLKESDKNCIELEQKVLNLEEELKSVYLNTIEIVKSKKDLQKQVQQLRSELDRMANTVKYVEDKEDEFENSYFPKINPLKSNIVKKSIKNQGTDPKMISIKNVESQVTEVKSEPPVYQNTIRNIYHNNRGVPHVDN